MPTNVIMPQLGESVVEGTIGRWLVREGDAVEKYAPLLEISTDKVDTEVPAPTSGTVLRLYFTEGTTLPAGTVIAVIGQPDETVPDRPAITPPAGESEVAAPADTSASAPVPSTPLPSPAGKPPGRQDLGHISPVVARIAREHNVDLSQVAGSGRGGRITKKDVLAYIEARQGAAREAPAAGLPPTAPGPARERPRPAAEPAPETVDHVVRPLSRVRRLVAEHTLASKRTAPHVTTVMEADMTAVVAHRSSLRQQYSGQDVRVTFTPYFVQAVITGLKAVPEVNAVWQPDRPGGSGPALLLKRRYHIGIATAVPDGLMVPVIHDADHYSLLGLARKVNDLVQRARAGQLKPDELQGSTFTLTNHGTSGSLLATPIINQPNVGILGVGAIQKRPVVISRGHPVEPSAADAIAIRPMVYLSFSFDHRVLDGAGADRFLAAVKETLEGWQ